MAYCPFCRTELHETDLPAQLDQAGETYLPAREYRCMNAKCVATAVTVTLPTGEPYKLRVNRA